MKGVYPAYAEPSRPVVESYCKHCGAVKPFVIIENAGPALVPLNNGGGDSRETLFTASTAPGYIVVGRCVTKHFGADGHRRWKEIVISRENRQPMPHVRGGGDTRE